LVLARTCRLPLAAHRPSAASQPSAAHFCFCRGRRVPAGYARNLGVAMAMGNLAVNRKPPGRPFCTVTTNVTKTAHHQALLPHFKMNRAQITTHAAAKSCGRCEVRSNSERPHGLQAHIEQARTSNSRKSLAAPAAASITSSAFCTRSHHLATAPHIVPISQASSDVSCAVPPTAHKSTPMAALATAAGRAIRYVAAAPPVYTSTIERSRKTWWVGSERRKGQQQVRASQTLYGSRTLSTLSALGAY
jgi:hypothetical protein